MNPPQVYISVFLPGKSHGQRSLEGYSPWGRKGSDMTEQLTLTFTCPLEKWVPKCSIPFLWSGCRKMEHVRKATHKKHRSGIQFWCVLMVRKIALIHMKKRTNKNIPWRCNRNDDINKSWHPSLCKQLSSAFCIIACVSLMLVQRISAPENCSQV